MAVKLFYEEYGTGLPVVCLHGYPLDHSIWKPLIPYLEEKAYLIIPDLRGHGKSPVFSEPYTMQDMAEDILTLLDDLGLSKVLLVGNSMGGYVSLQFARSFPKRLLGLILVASHPFSDSPKIKQGRLASIQKIREMGIQKVLAEFPSNLTPVPEIQDNIRMIIQTTQADGAVGSLRAMAERPDSGDVISNASFPVGIVLGKKDLFISQEQRDQMQAKFPQVEFSLVEKAAHMIMMEEPQAVAQMISKILEQYKE